MATLAGEPAFGVLHKTRQFQELVDLAADTVRNRDMMGVFGEKGLGKTVFGVYLCRHFPEFEWKYYCCQPNYGPRALFADLLNLFGLKPAEREPYWEMMREFKRCLHNETRAVLVVDELQRLSHNLLEMLRDLSDDSNCNVSLIWIGGKEGLRRIRKEDMLTSRMQYIHKIRPMGAAEMRELLPAFHPMYREADEAATHAILGFANGNFRRLTLATRACVPILERMKASTFTVEVFKAARVRMGELA